MDVEVKSLLTGRLEEEKAFIDNMLEQLQEYTHESQLYCLLKLSKAIAEHHKIDLKISEKKDDELIHDNIKLKMVKNQSLVFFLKDLK